MLSAFRVASTLISEILALTENGSRGGVDVREAVNGRVSLRSMPL